MKLYQQEFDEGRAAFKAGKPARSCPYSPYAADPVCYDEWMAGWLLASQGL